MRECVESLCTGTGLRWRKWYSNFLKKVLKSEFLVNFIIVKSMKHTVERVSKNQDLSFNLWNVYYAPRYCIIPVKQLQDSANNSHEITHVKYEDWVTQQHYKSMICYKLSNHRLKPWYCEAQMMKISRFCLETNILFYWHHIFREHFSVNIFELNSSYNDMALSNLTS